MAKDCLPNISKKEEEYKKKWKTREGFTALDHQKQKANAEDFISPPQKILRKMVENTSLAKKRKK